MPSMSTHPPVRSMRRWRIFLLIGLLFSLVPLIGQHPATGAGAVAPAGLRAADWQSIQAQLPQTYLKAANVDAYDWFGSVVAIDGDTLVVGAPGEASNGTGPTDNSAPNAGAVYVFIRSTPAQMAAGADAWVFQAYLKAANAEAEDYFGAAVALAGDTLVVGAWGEDSNGSSPNDNSTDRTGATYIFSRTRTAWSQEAYLKASTTNVHDAFGYTVAISDSIVVVGAPCSYLCSAPGAAYVFVRTTAAQPFLGTPAWSQQAILLASNADQFDAFGYTVAIDGDTVVIGAYGEASNGTGSEDDSAANAGAAYVFVRSTSQGAPTWGQQAYLKATLVEASDHFGLSVAIVGDILAISAPYEDSDGTSPEDNSAKSSGAVYLFVRTGTPEAPLWTQQTYLKAANAEVGDYFGEALAIDGGTLIVGAASEDSNGSDSADNSALSAGAIYLFAYTGTTWQQQAYRKVANADPDDRFGVSVAVAGETIVVGANGEDSDGSSPADNSTPYAGAAYAIELEYFPTALPLLMQP